MTAYLTIDDAVLAGCTGAGIRIAIIDSGVAVGHPHVGMVAGGTSLVGDDPADVADRLGHGTAVAAAIREKAPDAALVPVRVLDRQMATSARILAQAIDWAVEAGVQVVNLSLGTTNEIHVPLFQSSLEAAVARGVVVLSASAHDGTRWYPGSLAGALGVHAGAAVPRHAVAVVADETLGTTLAASPYPRPIPGVPVERNLWGVSFAVANASGIIARALQAGAPATPPHALLAWISARTLPPPPIPH